MKARYGETGRHSPVGVRKKVADASSKRRALPWPYGSSWDGARFGQYLGARKRSEANNPESKWHGKAVTH